MFFRRRNALAVAVALFYFTNLVSQERVSGYVNPFIGTGGHGHTFPGAVLPFGMVQLSPDTRIDGSWDGCGGYHYSDSIIYGFSHTHLSGTGVSDWGDVMLMPASASSSLDKKIYASKFSHKTEKASAGFYEVVLQDEKIKAELTATLRTGIHRYTFNNATEPSVILDLLHRDKLLSGSINIIDSCTVVGSRVSEAWAKEQHCYYAIRFSRAIKKTVFFKNRSPIAKTDVCQNNSPNQACFSFVPAAQSLLVKVGISAVSAEGALKNLEEEAPHWNFEKYKQEAALAWEEQLSKIVVKGKDTDQLATFYTALYHCFIHPSLNMDVDKQYRGRDNKIHTANGFTNYTVFSLWDTYRTLHPLFTLIERKRTADFINTFLHQYEQSGRLPMWELSGNETNCMIGYHAVSVIADAMVKNITGFDTALAVSAVKAAANYSGMGIPAYSKKGFLSVEDEPESVSKTLEYAYDDWCIAQMMRLTQREKDYDFFLARSRAYINLFDPSTGFMRPRKNGNWLSPFDPREVNNHYTEGNSWQYSFYVPQDIPALIQLHGGKKNFEKKLDDLFMASTQTTGRTQSDITGLIGQYAQGNEPSHHMAYLYNHVGSPNKTQEKISQIVNEFYKNSPDGLIGNEDCGQMSAWYVFSTLGFYPVCPGSTAYELGKPFFDSATINLENGKIFTLLKRGKNDAKYICSATLNGAPYNKHTLDHSDIIRGGVVSFTLQSSPQCAKNSFLKGTGEELSPGAIAAPIIVGPGSSFTGTQSISIKNLSKEKDSIFYTMDGSMPARRSARYTKPLLIDKNCTVKARVYNRDSSHISEATFHKKPHDWKIIIKSKYNKQYTAGGDDGIIDGIYGDADWRKGEWQGYQYQDFECVIDLKKEMPVSSVALDCLQDTRSWIIFPKQVEIFLSRDNVLFSRLEPLVNSVPADDYNVQVKKLEKKFDPREARYVKIMARNFGTLPEWHEGRGDGAFIFIDEIEIK